MMLTGKNKKLEMCYAIDLFLCKHVLCALRYFGLVNLHVASSVLFSVIKLSVTFVFVGFVLRCSWISIVHSILVAYFLRGFVYLSAYLSLFISDMIARSCSDIFFVLARAGASFLLPLVLIE
jgi:hypothetical protein